MFFTVPFVWKKAKKSEANTRGIILGGQHWHSIALLFSGFFGVAQKMTTHYISVGFVLFGWVDFQFLTNTPIFGSFSGIFNGLGILASFAAYYSDGKASKVTAISGALQLVFTIVLAPILKRQLQK